MCKIYSENKDPKNDFLCTPAHHSTIEISLGYESSDQMLPKKIFSSPVQGGGNRFFLKAKFVLYFAKV